MRLFAESGCLQQVVLFGGEPVIGCFGVVKLVGQEAFVGQALDEASAKLVAFGACLDGGRAIHDGCGGCAG